MAQFPGVILFIDVSGFTLLNDTLVKSVLFYVQASLPSVVLTNIIRKSGSAGPEQVSK